MTSGDLTATLFFSIVGLVSLAMGGTAVGVIFIVLAAIMVGMSMGKDMK